MTVILSDSGRKIFVGRNDGAAGEIKRKNLEWKEGLYRNLITWADLKIRGNGISKVKLPSFDENEKTRVNVNRIRNFFFWFISASAGITKIEKKKVKKCSEVNVGKVSKATK